MKRLMRRHPLVMIVKGRKRERRERHSDSDPVPSNGGKSRPGTLLIALPIGVSFRKMIMEES